MELAPNLRYSGGSQSSRGLIQISYASAKNRKGDDSLLRGVFLANHLTSNDNLTRTTKRQNTYNEN